MIYSEILDKVKDLAKKTGEFILAESEKFNVKDIQIKGQNDFVSYVDLEAEKRLVQGLKEILPDSGFIAEEGTMTNHNNDKYTWIVDPLDGTTNFMHGLPPYSISIALTYKNELILGLVYVIPSNEMFHAIRGSGAWLNKKQIFVSKASKIEDMLVGTGFPFKDYSLLNPYLNTLRYFIENTHGVRRMGSAAVDLAYLACGRLDSFFETNLNPWDVSAGILLIREAGGVVSDFSGNEDKLSGKEIIAANKLVYDDFFKVVSSSFMQNKIR